MSNEVSRVYQFLAKRPDWKIEMDIDGNGTILKSECSDFLKENFDWESLEGWNGENSSAKQTDLINQFWKSIDTKQTGSIAGTNFKNKNALDSKEIDNMSDKIEMYEILNDFTGSLQVPGIVSDSTRWKQSVSQSLGNLTETYIKKGGKKEELLAYLESVAPEVQNKTTADCVADEYLQTELKDFVKEYGYSYLDDATLNEIISNYIKNIPADSTEQDIQNTVKFIIDAYLATAGIKEDNAFDLSAYGYTTNPSSPLNDLQKTILTKTLQDTLEKVKNESAYKENSALFDSAVSEYINNILANAKFEDFENIKNYTYENFLSSDEYQQVTDILLAQSILKSDELYERVSSEISSSLADIIKNDGRYLNVMTEIETELLEKVQNGDFNVNGKLDQDKAMDWLIDEIRSRLLDFYQGSFGNLNIEDLNKLYDELYNAANNEADDEKSLAAHRNAAINYCDALAKKSPKLEEIITNIFGSNYEAEINKMYPADIKNKIEELKLQALELGDPNDLTLDSSSWGIVNTQNVVDIEASRASAISLIQKHIKALQDSFNSADILHRGVAKLILNSKLSALESIFGTSDYSSAINKMDEYQLTAAMQKVSSLFNEFWQLSYKTEENESGSIVLSIGESKTFNINPTFTDKNGESKTVTSDRITYKSSNTNIATIDENGTVTIKANNKGTYTVTLSVIVDGVEVGKNTITVSVMNSELGWENMQNQYNGYINMDGTSDTPNSVRTLGELYNSNASVNLLNSPGLVSGSDWRTCVASAKSGIASFVDFIANACQASGNYDQAALNHAKQKVTILYQSALDHSLSNWADKKSDRDNIMNFDGENYNYRVRKWYSDNTANDTSYAHNSNAANNDLGLQINEGYDNTTFQIVVNARCVMDLFEKFYKQALG